MSFNKVVISSFLLGVVVASVFIAVLLPCMGIGLYALGVDSSVSSSESSPEEPILKPSYRRFRDHERWAYPDKTVRLIQYMGPRFVRHHATGEFVNLVFEDHYRTGGYYLVQNAYVGLKIYDNKTVMYDPDMMYVAVEEERFSVQVYDPEESSWTALNLTASSLRVDAENSTAIVVTRVQEGEAGRLEATYIIRDGELMKYRITFTNLGETPRRFRVVQSLRGIHGENLTYESVEGSPKKLTVNKTLSLVAPLLRFEGGGRPVLTINMHDLGYREKGLTSTWTSNMLEGILVSTRNGKVEAEILMGDTELEPKESLTIDPRCTTTVVGSSWDTYITKIEDDRGYTTYDDTAWGLEYLRFGRHEDWNDERGCEEQYTYRTYLRWQILIPKEATIDSAFLNLSTRDWPAHNFTAYIGLLDFADCPEFSAVSGSELWNKKVLNVTGWNIEGNWKDEDWVSVNVTEHLEEFTGWSNYAPGNHMGLRIDEGTSGYGSWNYREVYSVDRGSKYAPRLEINFTYPYSETFVKPIENWSFENYSEWTFENKTLSSSAYSEWAYKKFHQIIGSTAGAQTDYQIRIVVHYGSGTDSGEDVYLEGKCRSDFGDIRFSTDGTALNYWMEEKTDGDKAVFWVKVPSIPAYPDNKTIVIHYGKSDATTTSNGANTFPFFDDFSGTSIDTSKWQYDTDSFTVSNGVARCTSSAKQIRSIDTFGDVEVRAKWRFSSGGRGNICFRKSYDASSSDRVRDPGYDVNFRNPNSDERLRKWPGGNAEPVTLATTSHTYTSDMWFVGFVRGYGSSLEGRAADDATLLSATDTAFSSGEVGLGVDILATEGTDYVEFDWVFVRKYVDPEPSHGAWISLDEGVYMHGRRSWHVSGPPNHEITIEQALRQEVVEYVRQRREEQNRGVCFSFWYKPDGVIESGDNKGEKNKARAEILYYDGSWHVVPENESEGIIKPDNASKWWHAQVYAELPPTTTQVKVRIRGYPYDSEGFKAWIDLALLSVYYYATNTSSYGNATLTTSIYYSNVIQHPEFDGFVSLGFGVAARAADGYSVAKLKDLTVELLPNNGTATTQQGRLIILYLTQENSKNITINELPLTFTTIGFDVAGFLVGLIPTATGIVCAVLAEKVTGTLLIKTGVKIIITAIKSVDLIENPYSHPFAHGDTSYKVWETLDYSGHLISSDDRIEYASAQYYFDWRFRTSSDDVFAIRVSAVVEWYQFDEGKPEDPTDDKWVYVGRTELLTVISIVDYW